MRSSGAALPYEPPARSERVLTVGDVIPEFRLPALAATVGNAWEFDSAWVRGRWVALLYWPKYSGLESPEDVTELARLGPAFAERDTQVVMRFRLVGRELSIDTLELYLETKGVLVSTSPKPFNPFGL